MNELQGQVNGGGGSYEQPGDDVNAPQSPQGTPDGWDEALEELTSAETVTV